MYIAAATKRKPSLTLGSMVRPPFRFIYTYIYLENFMAQTDYYTKCTKSWVRSGGGANHIFSTIEVDSAMMTMSFLNTLFEEGCPANILGKT
jgi:hypothetical protein